MSNFSHKQGYMFLVKAEECLFINFCKAITTTVADVCLGNYYYYINVWHQTILDLFWGGLMMQLSGKMMKLLSSAWPLYLAVVSRLYSADCK